jgi:hypothetical protein
VRRACVSTRCRCPRPGCSKVFRRPRAEGALALATVVFSGTQRALADGNERVDIEARRVSDLLTSIYARFPKLEGKLDGSAVAIDGDIHNDPQYLRLEHDSEVHFLAQVQGG